MNYQTIVGLLFVLCCGTAQGAEESLIKCPGSPTTAGSRLSVFLVCEAEEANNADCRTLIDLEGKSLSLKWTSRLDMNVKKAAVEEMDSTPYIHIDLSDESRCWFHKITAEHIRERLAVVYDEKVLVAPMIMSAIPGGELQLMLGYSSTPKMVTELCRQIDPEYVGIVSWRERVILFFKKIRGFFWNK